MWKVYKANHYIQGELISQHRTEALARKQAIEEIEHSYTVKEETSKEVLIWLENEDRMPIGIVTKQKGTKRIRQGKKKKQCKQVRYDLNSSKNIVANNNNHFDSVRLAA